MKHDPGQIAHPASRIYAAKITIQPALATAPETPRMCVTEAVNLIDEALQLEAELNPPKPSSAKKKPERMIKRSFGSKR